MLRRYVSIIIKLFPAVEPSCSGCKLCVSQSRKTTPSPVKEKKFDTKMGKKPDVRPATAKREETTVSAFFGTAPIKRTHVPRKRKERVEEEVRVGDNVTGTAWYVEH